MDIEAFLRQELARVRRLAQCGSVTSWLSLPDEQKREWFASMLTRDKNQVRRIRKLEDLLQDCASTLAALPSEHQTRVTDDLRARIQAEFPDEG